MRFGKWLQHAVAASAVAALALSGGAMALDKVKVAGSQRNFWDTTTF